MLTKAAKRAEELRAAHEPIIVGAFRDAVADLVAQVDLQRLIAAIHARDLETALAALHIEATVYNALAEAIRVAYLVGGEAEVEAMPSLFALGGARHVIRFNTRSPAAEGWVRDHTASLIAYIADDQRDAARNALVRHIENRSTARAAALDLVGTPRLRDGVREGGLLGLSAQQEDFVARARAELASQDPAEVRKYLSRTRRDVRFDGNVARAIDSGKILAPEIKAKAAGAYKRRLLDLRCELVGRTEAKTAIQAGRQRAWEQAVEGGKAAGVKITKTWRSNKASERHQGMNGVTAGLHQRFVTPNGALLLYPGDPSAPVGERISCDCNVEFRIVRHG